MYGTNSFNSQSFKVPEILPEILTLPLILLVREFKGPRVVTKTIAVRFFVYRRKQRTPSPSLVTFYDTPGKVWAASIFFVALPAGQ